jgi:putative glycosyltransferase (TIGR04348 family)
VKVLIVTPESPTSPLGNSITAARWAGILRTIGHAVDIAGTWTTEDCDLLIALHALRSEDSVERFRAAHPDRPIIVALTGTDLYRDLPMGKGHRSLAMATRVVALQEAALNELSSDVRAKTTVIYQSAGNSPSRHPSSAEEGSLPSSDYFDVCVLSHLRAVKDPLRAAHAARSLPAGSRIRVTHAGRALEPEWEEKARAEERANPRYHWIGEQSHESAMQLVASSRLLVLSSRMEGGANVIAEAVVCSVPVLCSDIPGNIGMLSADYPGYFRVGDTDQLATLLNRAEMDSSFLAGLQSQISKFQLRFAPETELKSWKALIQNGL